MHVQLERITGFFQAFMSGIKGLSGFSAGSITQRAQYPFIKEHTLNHNIKAPYNLRYVSYLKGIGLVLRSSFSPLTLSRAYP